jgi:ketosteroid isomerase-like protein
MKVPFILTLAGLLIGFAVPVLAQEKEEVTPFPFRPIAANPQIAQQLEPINLKFDEACSKHDAAAVAALYTTNAILATPLGEFSGREAIEKYFTDCFQRFNPSDQVTKMSYVYAFAGDLCAIGGWSLNEGHQHQQHGGGYLVNVYTRGGGTWKIRASVFKYRTGP